MREYYPSKVWKNCPYCGSPSITWEGGTHKMHCEYCSKSFYINAASAVVALIRNQNGEFIFTRRKNDPAKGKLDLPGGFVNLEERSEDAVVREVKEELNIDVTKATYYTSVPNRYLFGGIVYFTLDLVYICEYENMNNISANDDISDFVFMNINNVNVEDIGLESIKKIVVKLKNDTI